ncbi:MAG: hypothetical protein WC831_01305 [Parcubacteria group bacterium]|jgi:hypothetical protein
METIKRLFGLNLSPKEVVWGKKILAITVLPVMIFYTTSMNFVFLGVMNARAVDAAAVQTDDASSSSTAPAKDDTPSEDKTVSDDTPKDASEKDPKPEAPKAEEKTVEAAKNEAVQPDVAPPSAPKAETPVERVPETVVPTITEEPVSAEEVLPKPVPAETTPAEPLENTVKPAENPADTVKAPVNETAVPEVVAPEAAPAAETVVEKAPAPKPEWQLSEDKKTAVIGPVELGETYKAPQNEEVTVVFTKLPEKAGNLSIEEITLTDEQVSAMNALSNKAYDVTSDMADGTFKYDLTLPKPKDEQKVEIKYAENVNDLEKAETVSDNLTKTETASVSATLDHFTIFVVTAPTQAGGVCTDVVGATGSDKCFNTIQEAINDPATVDGSTINVAEGTYDVAETIIINKALTIAGPSSGVAKVQGTNSGVVSIFEITASNVTIQRLEITHGALPAFVSTGWAELPNSLIRISTGTGLTGITIENNSIYVPVQSGAMNTWNGVAITIGAGTTAGISITNNIIHNTRNGVVVQYNNTATVSDNDIYDTKGGVMNYTNTQSDADNRTVNNNTWGTTHNEWDVVWNTAYYVPDYQESVVEMSSNNNEAFVVDRRAADAAACASLKGNRSHVFVNTTGGTSTASPVNGNMNLPYSTIQLGLDAVVPGGTIYVAAGNYSELVNITKNVVLDAESGVNLTGSINISHDDITIDGFNITNPNAGYGIIATDVSNLSVTNNTIHDVGTALTGGSVQAIGIVSSSNDVANIDIENNNISRIGNLNLVFSGSGSAKGIYLGNSTGSKTISDATISNNQISNVFASTAAWTAGRGAYGILVNHKTTGLHITSNTISTLEGLWAHAIGLETDTPSAIVSGNTISGLTDHKGGTDAMALRLESNPSASTVSATGNTFNSKALVLDDATSYVDKNWAQTPDANTYPEVLASDGDSYLYYGIDAFSTVQDAINCVSSGDTVNVAAGTYNESVLIEETLTLNGVGGTKPIISGSAGTNYVLKISGAGANGTVIDNLEINGGGDGTDDNSFDYGVLVNASGTSENPVEIENSTVKNIWKNGSNGIEADDGSYALMHDDNISSFHKRGVRFINSEGKVYGSEIIGDNVDGTSRVQNLVNLWGGSTVEIYGNKLHNALTTAGMTPTWDSPAIFVSSYGGNGASHADVHNNEIYNSDTGVVVGSFYADVDTSSVAIANNDFHNLNWAINFEKGTISATITAHNKFTAVERAISADDSNGGPDVKPAVNAEENWWGDQSGPSGEGKGVGGSVVANVDYSPWCLDEDCSSTSDIYADGDSKGVTLSDDEQDVTVDNLTINDVEGSGTMFVAKYDSLSDVPEGGVTFGVDNFYYNVDASGITNFPIKIEINYVDSPDADPNYLDENHFSSLYYYDGSDWKDYKLDSIATTGYDPSEVSIDKDANIITAYLQHLTPIVPVLDTTAPSVPILTSPIDEITNDNTPLMQWEDSADTDGSGVAGYEYQVYFSCSDSSNIPASCSGPYSYGSLILDSQLQAGTTSDNTYYWQVRAKDNVGNFSAWSNFGKVTIDTHTPAKPTGLKFQSQDRTKDFACGASVPLQVAIPDWDDVTSDPTFSHYEYTSFQPDESIGLNERVLNVSELNNSWMPPAEGAYGYAVRSVDKADNKSDWALSAKTLAGSCQIIYDSTAPTVDLFFPAIGQSAKTFQAVFSENVNESEAENLANYFLDNWPGAGGSGDLVGDATISYDAGTKTATVTLTNSGWYISPEQEWGVQDIHDLAGNLQAENPRKETSTPMIAPTNPDTLVSTPNPTNIFTQAWTWLASMDSGGSGVKGYYQRIHNIVTLADSAWSWIGNVLGLTTNLTDGEYQLQLKAEDNAGNESGIVSSETLIVDSVPPVITIDSYTTAPTNDDITVTASTDEGTLNADSHTFTENDSFDFVATDDAGNSTTETVTITNIDKDAPAVPQLPIPANNSYLNTHNFTFLWSSVSDSGSSIIYEWEFSYSDATKGDSSFVSRSGFHGSLSSPEVASPGTPDNIYYWHVRAIDAASNASAWSDPWKVTVDNAAPDTAINSGPSGLVNAQSATFTFSSPDNTASFECQLDSGGIFLLYKP